MADTISSYKGDTVRLNTRALGMGGYNAQVSSSASYVRELDAFARAGGALATAYTNAIIERDTRDADTQISKLFRERRIHILQTVKGKQTDGLVDREEIWQQEQYKEFSENTNLEPLVVRDLWQKYAKSYMDKTGSYMVEQQALYDKQSRLAASDEINDQMVMTDIGDVNALMDAFNRNEQLFINDPMQAEKQNDKVIMTAVGTWARQNPYATIQWFNANREELKKQFGAKYINVSDAIDKAERKIQAEVKHAETLAARADRIRTKEDKAYSEAVLGDFLTLLARDEADALALYAVTDDPRVQASNKLTAYNAFRGMEKAEKTAATAAGKARQENIEDELGARVVSDGWDNTSADIIRHISNGDIPYAALGRLNNLREEMAKVPTEAKPFISNAETYISEKYVGKQDMFSMPDPAKVEQKNRMISAIRRRAYESPTTVAQDFDINDPESWVSKLVKANPTIKPNFSSGASPFDASPSVITIIRPGFEAQDSSVPTGNQVLDRLRAKGIKPRS